MDLRHRSAELGDLRVAGALFLGCRFAPATAERVEARGAIVVPDLPVAPVDLHRDHLYRPEDLYDAPTYADSLDARAYAWSQTAHDRDASMAKALHDHAVDVALADWVAGPPPGRRDGRPCAGAGHARLPRRRPARAATGRATTWSPPAAGPARWRPRTSGATWPASAPRPTTCDDALALLAAVPSFRPSVDAWVRAGFAVLDRFPGGGDTLGIPTWFYGHEPPNVLATAIAKYVRNAVSARRSCSRSATPASSSCPARRHGPGGVPGRLRELLRRRVLGRAHGAGGPDVLDRDPARLAVARGPGPRPPDGAARPPRRRRGRGRRTCSGAEAAPGSGEPKRR